MSEQRCGLQAPRDARFLIDLVCAQQPFVTWVRLEAAYQHYARFQVMEGFVPSMRRLWWRVVFEQDPIFAAQLLAEPNALIEAGEGVQL